MDIMYMYNFGISSTHAQNRKHSKEYDNAVEVINQNLGEICIKLTTINTRIG